MGEVFCNQRHVCQIGLCRLVDLTSQNVTGCGSTPASGKDKARIQLVFRSPTSRHQLTKKRIGTFWPIDLDNTTCSTFSGWRMCWSHLDTQDTQDRRQSFVFQ
jgi:hypothetical protein